MGDDLDVLQSEQSLALRRGDGELDGRVLAADETVDFQEGPGWHEEADVFGYWFEQFALEDGEPKPVRGGEREVIAGDLDFYAGQDGTRILGGGGEGDVSDGVFEDRGGNLAYDAGVDGGDGRKVVGVLSVDVSIEPGAAQLQTQWLLNHGDVDRLLGQ